MAQEAYIRLVTLLKKHTSAAVAFSGGTDSTLLLHAAREALGNQLLALTVKTPYIPDWEIREAADFCRQNGIRYTLVEMTIPERIRKNPEDRCYLCKRMLFERLLSEARSAGMEVLMEGTNADDVLDYRPGLRALQELGILSPLREAGITKEAVRQLSKTMHLPTWDKPAYACLLTRLPYNQPIREEMLERIEKAERFLMESGFRAIRVRTDGDSARIEMDKELFHTFFAEGFYERAAGYIKSLGFKMVTLDLEGYRKGSFNSTLKTSL